jgi:predicted O-methyltransferase YrrM
MQKINSRIHTLLWYLKRPGLYPDLIRESKNYFLKSNLQLDGKDDKKEAEIWCERLSIDTKTALEKITGNKTFEPISKKYNKIFQKAQRVAKSCPVKMGGPGNVDLLYWISEHLKAKKVVETGVAYGWSSLAILLSLMQRENSTLISTDKPYPKLNNDDYVGCVVPDNLKSNWQMIKMADRDALPRALKRLNTIDMCHYDSDKSYEGRKWAYPLLWEAIRFDGCFISDDINNNLAFHDFCKKIDKKPFIIETTEESGIKYVGVLIKTNTKS